jgi:hypothetical protein
MAKQLLIWLTLCVFCYIGTAFVAWEFNPANWGLLGRYALIVEFLVCVLVTKIIYWNLK